MKNYQQKGDVLDYVAATDIVSGAVVVSGGFVGVAVTDIATGETGAVRIDGVVKLPIDGVTAFAQGAAVDFDGTNCVAAIGGDLVGKVFNAAISGDTTVSVKLAG